MKLRIDNVEHEFIPIKDFRETHKLPDSFGIAQFEPKNYEGLGSLDSAGSAMNELREHVLQLIPDIVTFSELLRFIDHIQLQFQTDLFNINDSISLKDVEVEYAVAGFGDVLRAIMYKMIPAKASKDEMPSFDSIYYGWINDSVRISRQVHDFQHDETNWKVQIVNHVYGRAGLQITMNDKIIYVADGIYLCPAEGFMYTLLKDVSLKIWSALK
jgi:hypothetical protein